MKVRESVYDQQNVILLEASLKEIKIMRNFFTKEHYLQEYYPLCEGMTLLETRVADCYFNLIFVKNWLYQKFSLNVDLFLLASKQYYCSLYIHGLT